MFGGIAKRYDLANHALSGGIDFLWRARVGKIVARWNPQTVLDLATGSGDLALELRKRLPEATVVGADFCIPMLEQAASKGMPSLVAADGMCLPFRDHAFDAITIAFGFRNMKSYPEALDEFRRVLRPGGHLLILDFSMPRPPLQRLYRWYLHHVLPEIAGRLTGDQSAYQYLGDSIEAFPRDQKMLDLIKSHGFRQATQSRQTFGIATIYSAQKNPEQTTPEKPIRKKVPARSAP